MIPAFPAQAVRSALESGDWDRAGALLAAHESELRAELASEPPAGAPGDTSHREALLALLHAQQAFLAELTATRDETAAALGQLGRDKRGVQAYRAAG